MRIKKNCKTCGKQFTAIKTTQFFCSRKCFRKDYNKKKREEEQNRPKKYPGYNCANCKKISLMNFDPISNSKMFDEFECPYCGYSPKFGWDNRHKIKEQPTITVMHAGFFSSTSLKRIVTITSIVSTI